jgi:uncharacterized protein YnzC (UPF0291/DUF896 family)
MINEEQIKRINELAKKRKDGTLTQEEVVEQQELRRLYVESVKTNLRAQVENIEIVDK